MNVDQTKMRISQTPQPGKQFGMSHSCKKREKGQRTSQLPALNPEQHIDMHNFYKDIISLNRNYLTNKLKVSEVKKPNQYYHKLPSKTGQTQYTRRYQTNQNQASFDATNSRIEPSGIRIQLPRQQVTNLKSSYMTEFKSDKQSRSGSTVTPIRPRGQKFFIDTGLTLKESSYKKDYSNKGFDPNVITKQLESIILGGKFKEDTTYKNSYDHMCRFKTQPTEPILQKEHKIFVGIKKAEQSRYQQNFHKNQNEILTEAPIRPSNHLATSFQKMIEKSTYKTHFEPKSSPKLEDFMCMDSSELDSFILSSK